MGKRKDKRKAKAKSKAAKQELKAFTAFLMTIAARHAARTIVIDTMVRKSEPPKAAAE